MFKSLQVLRTVGVVKSLKGTKLPSGTRVVVVNAKEDNGSWSITARVQDPALPDLAKIRAVLKPTQVTTTKRGRPARAEGN